MWGALGPKEEESDEEDEVKEEDGDEEEDQEESIESLRAKALGRRRRTRPSDHPALLGPNSLSPISSKGFDSARMHPAWLAMVI